MGLLQIKVIDSVSIKGGMDCVHIYVPEYF
jgi:hypothetical protein